MYDEALGELSPSRPLRVLIVDDHLMVGETIARLLSLTPEFNVMSVPDIHSANTLIVEQGVFDVVLLDYEMPGMDALEGMSRLIEANSGGVALFSGVAKWTVVDRAIDRGAVGFVPKTAHPKTLQNAIRLMADGEVYLPAEYMRRSRFEEVSAIDLTQAERKVLELLCEGMTNKEIGRELNLNEVNVKMHVRSLFRKLGARNRTQAVLAAQKLGICE